MINIQVLIENTTISDAYEYEHGLSFFIHWEERDEKILFDFGETNAYMKNAEKLNVDLAQIDLAVLSHGHYDHGGGMKGFLELNKKADIYVNEKAFGYYYSILQTIDIIETWNSKENPAKYIGLDQDLKEKKQIKLVADYCEIEPGVHLVGNIPGGRYFPEGNRRLLKRENGRYGFDDFVHEQNLVIEDGEHVICFAGCAHRGVINIIDAVETKLGRQVTHLISGLHLYNKKANMYEPEDTVSAIGSYLKEKNINVYTGHCTGEKAYKHLKTILDGKLHYLHTGLNFKI